MRVKGHIDYKKSMEMQCGVFSERKGRKFPTEQFKKSIVPSSGNFH